MERKLLAPLALLILLPILAHAHPHMWIDGTIELHLDNSGLSALTATWAFDEFNSAEMIFMFDDDLDGELSRAEVEAIRDQAFAHLVQLDYFLIAFAGQDRLEIPQADSFDARIERGRLIYEFTVPLRLPWSRLDDTVIAFFDVSYFIDFLSEGARDRYAHGSRTVRLRSDTLRLASQGWGTIQVPAVRTAIR